MYLLFETTGFWHDSLETSLDSITTLVKVLRGYVEKLHTVSLDWAEKERKEYIPRAATEESYELRGTGG